MTRLSTLPGEDGGVLLVDGGSELVELDDEPVLDPIRQDLASENHHENRRELANPFRQKKKEKYRATTLRNVKKSSATIGQDTCLRKKHERVSVPAARKLCGKVFLCVRNQRVLVPYTTRKSTTTVLPRHGQTK